MRIGSIQVGGDGHEGWSAVVVHRDEVVVISFGDTHHSKSPVLCVDFVTLDMRVNVVGDVAEEALRLWERRKDDAAATTVTAFAWREVTRWLSENLTFEDFEMWLCLQRNVARREGRESLQEELRGLLGA